MTGAIATVVAMSALSGATGEAGRPFAAPPSSLKRSVSVVAQTTALQRGSYRQARSSSARPRPVVVARHLVVARQWSHRPRQLTASKQKTKPKPAPARAPEPAPTPASAPELAPPTVAAAQIVEPPQPTAPAAAQGPPEIAVDAHGDHGNGRGHAHGHDKHDE